MVNDPWEGVPSPGFLSGGFWGLVRKLLVGSQLNTELDPPPPPALGSVPWALRNFLTSGCNPTLQQQCQRENATYKIHLVRAEK